MPYGLIDGDLEPRWTYGQADGTVRQVEFLDDLPNSISLARMQQKIHKISGDTCEEDTYIDLSIDEAEAHKKSSRVLIRSNLQRIRDRNKSDDFEPENIVPVSSKIINRTIERIENNAAIMRKHFLEEVIPLMVGYDIAAGEAEAIARDELETDMEIDSEIALYLERITVASLLSRTMRKKFDKDFVDAQIGKWVEAEFAQVRDQVKSDKNVSGQRRFMNQLRDLVAQRKDGDVDHASNPIGIKRSMTKQNAPEYNLN